MGEGGTVIADGVEFYVCWHGGTHREFPQPQIAVDVESRHLTDEVRAFFSSRNGLWFQACNVSRAVDASSEAVLDRIRRLVASGELRRRAYRRIDGTSRGSLYSWDDRKVRMGHGGVRAGAGRKPESAVEAKVAKPKMRRFTPVEFQAMRERLAS